MILRPILCLSIFALTTALFSQDHENPFPPMVPAEFMEPGFHRSLDEKQFPDAIQEALSQQRRRFRANRGTANALFQEREYQSRFEDAKERYGGHESLTYQIMYPDPEAERPAAGYPLVFSTYGRTTLSEIMALPEYRQEYPAYVVAFIHKERPGPLHAPPVYSDFSFLFLELFEHLFAEYDIDQNRVYGSGWSRGGSSMTILSHAYASRNPDKEPLFTAIVPSAGGFQSLEDNAVESIKDVKILSMQGASDTNSPPTGSLQAFDALEKAGALDNIFWWIENTGHSPHRLGWFVGDVVHWLFSQNKSDLALRPEARLAIDQVDQQVPFTVSADASPSQAQGEASITEYSWQLLQSRAFIADYSERHMHGYHLDTGFQGSPVIGSEAQVQVEISEPGTYWLRVIVTDSEGRRRAATQEIHARRAQPQAQLSFSRNYEAAGTPVHFDASASLAEYQAELASYAWDFGDGNSGSGPTASHTYAQPGEYTVTLTATSNKGISHAAKQTITISDTFPGYRYFRFTGLTTHHTYRTPRIRSFLLKNGDELFPPQPMTSNQSQGILLEASWETDSSPAWQAFDHSTDTAWSSHNYHTPVTLLMDVGENQRFVPSGASVVMADRNNRWVHFFLEGSVDQASWDELWHHRERDDGRLDNDGSEIVFEGR